MGPTGSARSSSTRTGCATTPRAGSRIRPTEQIAGSARLFRFGGKRSSTTRPRGTSSSRKRGTAAQQDKARRPQQGSGADGAQQGRPEQCAEQLV
eukprot:8834482-Alexandrium_andersonii.AAC.1